MGSFSATVLRTGGERDFSIFFFNFVTVSGEKKGYCKTEAWLLSIFLSLKLTRLTKCSEGSTNRRTMQSFFVVCCFCAKKKSVICTGSF